MQTITVPTELLSLKDAVADLSDRDLGNLSVRLHQNLTGDLADVLEICSAFPSLHIYLESANSHKEFYGNLDGLMVQIDRESRKRSSKDVKGGRR